MEVVGRLVNLAVERSLAVLHDRASCGIDDPSGIIGSWTSTQKTCARRSSKLLPRGTGKSESACSFDIGFSPVKRYARIAPLNHRGRSLNRMGLCTILAKLPRRGPAHPEGSPGEDHHAVPQFEIHNQPPHIVVCIPSGSVHGGSILRTVARNVGSEARCPTRSTNPGKT